MINYVTLKNFKSFGNVTFDFQDNGGKAKKFAAIYGENGSGKSNFVDSIRFIRNSIDSLTRDESLKKVIEMLEKDNDTPTDFKSFFREQSSSNMRIDCRMIDCDDPTEIEMGFIYNGHKGNYQIHFTDRIIYERLYYFTGKQSGQLFEIKNKDNRIAASLSDKMFQNKKIAMITHDLIEQYWGKHTLLSILNDELTNKNESYIHDNYTPYVFECINAISGTLIHSRSSFDHESEIRTKRNYNKLVNLNMGRINVSLSPILDSCEQILNDFFTQAYADIKQVFYKRELSENKIQYELYIKKTVGGKLRVIPFSKESAGTQNILRIFRSLLGALSGITIVYDEIDNGIHDLLFKNIITSLKSEITGQVIITTHNTFLLESLNPKDAYVINIDYEGNKEVNCLTDFPRIQKNNNARSIYMKGGFGGIPNIDYIDYTEIKEKLYNIDSVELIEGGNEFI